MIGRKAFALPAVVPVSAFCGVLAPGLLGGAEAHTKAIAAHWREALATQPKLFNGRVLVAESVAFRGGRFEATFRETDYATFLWLKAGGRLSRPVHNVFSAAAVVSADGAVLLGRMAAHTTNAGEVYFPCGTPDRNDVVGGTVDLEGALLRELEEETGLDAGLLRPSDTRFVVDDGRLHACIRRFDSTLDARALVDRIERHVEAQALSELAGVVAARSAGDLTAASPAYVHAAVAHLLGA